MRGGRSGYLARGVSLCWRMTNSPLATQVSPATHQLIITAQPQPPGLGQTIWSHSVSVGTHAGPEDRVTASTHIRLAGREGLVRGGRTLLVSPLYCTHQPQYTPPQASEPSDPAAECSVKLREKYKVSFWIVKDSSPRITMGNPTNTSRKHRESHSSHSL